MAPSLEPIAVLPQSIDDVNYINLVKLADQLETLSRSGPVNCDERTRKRLLDAVKAALPELEKKEDATQRILYTPLEVMAARIGVNMDLFNKLVQSERPLSTEELAAPLGANVSLLERLLKFISALKFIKEVDVGTWGPSTTTHYLTHRGVAGGVSHNTDNLGVAWLALPEYLERTKYQIPTDIKDSAFSQGHGVKQGIFDWFLEHPKHMHEFNMWMTAQRYGDERWLDAVPFKSLVLQNADPSAPLFVDVAGGIGHQSKALLTQFESMKGRVILQDQAEVVKDALPVEGMSVQPIDFFKGQPVKNARVYYMRNILHDWTDEYCSKILTHIKAAMGPNSMLFIDEMVIPNKGAHKIAMQVDMTMLANCISEERSEGRWKELLSSVGFKIDHVYTYQPELGDSIIVATPV